jgi:hypothetical protein
MNIRDHYNPIFYLYCVEKKVQKNNINTKYNFKSCMKFFFSGLILKFSYTIK